MSSMISPPIPQKLLSPVDEVTETLSRLYGISRLLILMPSILVVLLVATNIATFIAWRMGIDDVPDIITTSSDCGPIRGLIQAATSGENLSDEVLTRELEHFIRDLRQVFADPKINEQNTISAGSHILDGQAYKYINEWHDSPSGPPARFLENRRVYIKVREINKIEGKSFHVVWDEEVLDDSGHRIENGKYSGTFTLKIVPISSLTLMPERRRELQVYNPLGWFVEEVRWSHILQGDTSDN